MDNLENQTTTEVKENVPQTVNTTMPLTQKNNTLGLIGFIGYFVSIFTFLLFAVGDIPAFMVLAILMIIASLTLSIIGFIKRNKYGFFGFTVAGFALNINYVLLISWQATN